MSPFLPWQSEAACAGLDPDLFFPESRKGGDTITTVKMAQMVCADCAVREACLDHAFTNHERYGIWGGLT
ncbi:MAG: WhiB family transcriptional regulator, partial [bacterium]